MRLARFLCTNSWNRSLKSCKVSITWFQILCSQKMRPPSRLISVFCIHICMYNQCITISVSLDCRDGVNRRVCLEKRRKSTLVWREYILVSSAVPRGIILMIHVLKKFVDDAKGFEIANVCLYYLISVGAQPGSWSHSHSNLKILKAG